MSPPTTVVANPSAPLSESDVTLHKLKSIFDAAYIKAEFDSDGDLKIEDNGFKTFVQIDRDKGLIIFFAIWAMKASVPEIKRLKLVNTLNNDLIFVRFCMPRPTTLWCDYQFLFEGGITPFTIVHNYRLFAKVTKGAVATQDPEDIIGSD